MASVSSSISWKGPMVLVLAVPQVNLVDSVIARDPWTDASRFKVRTDQLDNNSPIDVLAITIRRTYLEK